jgi:pimeloyl-ACP methyl ester carboxylesterase
MRRPAFAAGRSLNMTPFYFTLPDGRKLAYQMYGDPDGVPTFFFHGWPSSRTQAVLMDEAGKELGLCVVGVDRPGIGKSDPKNGRRLLDWPGELARLAARLGWDRFHVFGVSGGGPYVLATCHAMPERVLSASIICGAPPLRLLGTRDLFWPYQGALLMRRFFPWLLAPAFGTGLRLSYLKPHQFPMNLLMHSLSPADREALKQVTTHQAVVESFREAVRSGIRNLQTDGDIYTSDWGFDLKAIQVPIHFWHGKRDRNIPWTYAAKVAAMIPNSTSHWTEDDGHYSLPVLRAREIAEVALGLPQGATHHQ